MAEEEVLYSAVRKYVDGGDDLADKRIEEQAEAERQLADMEKLDPQSWSSVFAELRDAVLQQAAEEEAHVFPALAHATHAHHHAPDTPPGNVLFGPVSGPSRPDS